MRLEKIKLAGFKSFVDPTNVLLPGNLVGIVGPNGCGKSNVIDAVRWVMGESSAKMLRGESMSDVIFNGSNTRKPVGTAGIELVFDNSDGSAGGEYAKYSQISVKRQVSRDGQSSYFMNGIRCRRRDITGLFLGTGLGPRSYSIIEQGTISRLIEAKPEELRSFLEEAAGISKYKERRRETQNRISHTRENLDRLNDLREEISKQLQHLQRQAATAERYKRLKEQERRMQAELLALRWREMDQELTQKQRTIGEQETALEAGIADQRRLEAEMERQRETHVEANEQFNEVQGQFYAVGSEIARLEQAIQFARENRAKLERDLQQTKQAWLESSEHRQQDEARCNELSVSLAQEEPRLLEIEAQAKDSTEQLAVAEQALHAWQTEWENFNRQAAEPAQTAQVERTRINHLEQQEQHLQQRIGRNAEELKRLDDPRLQQEIAELEAREEEHQTGLRQAQDRLSAAAAEIQSVRVANLELGKRLDEAKAQLQTAKGRLASLQVLQEAALGKEEGGLTHWLEARGLANAARLAEQLEVDAGWETAVETVLGFHLQAVCVAGFSDLAREIEALESGNLALFDTSAGVVAAGGPENSLQQRVRAPWPIEGMFSGVRTAETFAEALVLRERLGPGESIITPEGIWLGRNWLRLNRESAATSGVLEREQEIRLLAEDVVLQEQRTEELTAAVAAGRDQLSSSEQVREDQQRRLGEINRAVSEIRSLLSGKQARAEHLRNRSAQLDGDIEELKQQIEQGREQLQAARGQLHAALEEMETLAERREELIQRRDQLRSGLADIRQQADRQRAEAHAMALRIGSMRTSHDSLRQGLERMSGQLSQLDARRTALATELEQGQAPLQQHSDALALQLARRVEVEAELSKARQTLEQIEARLRTLEQNRSTAEQEVQRRRDSLGQARMQSQEVLVRRRTVEERLDETEFQRDQLLQNLPADARLEQWLEEEQRMEARIRRLGPINLAAIDEFQEQSERMRYLDAQHADVTESLETLENAIRKIDRETRTRFKETFDQVNNGLQEKFPQLFGGGHAYLQLTGEDLLDTGVTVMARPPGKRNSSIQLLSGGEKALTAVALVFAIFELNPAPFCMLDEVDAPLDDANVGRFCDMVKAMSNRVQFIFITHNKITMEIANQLTGVTMYEPGVSRLVSVDVDEASLMAAM